MASTSYSESPCALIREKLDGRNAYVKAFYAALWVTEVVKGEPRKCKSVQIVERDSISRFCKVVQNDAEQFVRGQDRLAAPLDYAIVAGWQAVVQPTFSGFMDGGEKIETQAEFISTTNTPTDKKIPVQCTLARDGIVLVEAMLIFFARSAFDNYHSIFNNVDEEPISVTVRRPQDLAVLEFKEDNSFDAASPKHESAGYKSLIYGDHFYTYKCTACGAGQGDAFQRIPMNWPQTAHLALYHLTETARRADEAAGFIERAPKQFRLNKEINNFVESNWSVLAPGRELNQSWRSTLSTAVNNYADTLFRRAQDTKKQNGWWSLIEQTPPMPGVRPPKKRRRGDAPAGTTGTLDANRPNDDSFADSTEQSESTSMAIKIGSMLANMIHQPDDASSPFASASDATLPPDPSLPSGSATPADSTISTPFLSSGALSSVGLAMPSTTTAASWPAYSVNPSLSSPAPTADALAPAPSAPFPSSAPAPFQQHPQQQPSSSHDAYFSSYAGAYPPLAGYPSYAPPGQNDYSFAPFTGPPQAAAAPVPYPQYEQPPPPPPPHQQQDPFVTPGPAVAPSALLLGGQQAAPLGDAPPPAAAVSPAASQLPPTTQPPASTNSVASSTPPLISVFAAFASSTPHLPPADLPLAPTHAPAVAPAPVTAPLPHAGPPASTVADALPDPFSLLDSLVPEQEAPHVMPPDLASLIASVLSSSSLPETDATTTATATAPVAPPSPPLVSGPAPPTVLSPLAGIATPLPTLPLPPAAPVLQQPATQIPEPDPTPAAAAPVPATQVSEPGPTPAAAPLPFALAAAPAAAALREAPAPVVQPAPVKPERTVEAPRPSRKRVFEETEVARYRRERFAQLQARKRPRSSKTYDLGRTVRSLAKRGGLTALPAPHPEDALFPPLHFDLPYRRMLFGIPDHEASVPRSHLKNRPLKPYIRRDYEPRSALLTLVQALRARFASDPERWPEAAPAAAAAREYPDLIDYCYFAPRYREQANALLARLFWPGIDVHESVPFPELGIVAVYRKLVVGCAFITHEGYISYIGVAPGWTGAGIASFMLYWLCQSTSRDVTLHVSANNSAMILYQKFGFKPEEFIMNFYERYYQGDECKHAFFCRLRR
ncbi:hypothetical protein H9P43_004018 [Blastocladiella emersonii ATCC 22665]|nr:hypothetical protein H9P43_004018 [Blastocladiella emersonii ATCC 22665]